MFYNFWIGVLVSCPPQAEARDFFGSIPCRPNTLTVNFGSKKQKVAASLSGSMVEICNCKQLFWTVHNSNFQKLYLRWKFVKWPPLFGQQTWWGNEPGWWRKLWSTIPDRSLGTQGTPNVEDPAKANKFWATIHIYYIYKKTQNSALKTHPRNWNRDGFAVYVGTYLYVLCIYFNVRLRM